MSTVRTVYRLKGLVKQYDGAPVVSVDNMEIVANEIVAVFGPNGSGKTTLLNMLAFLDAPSSGEMRFDGRPLTWTETNLHQLRHRVTLVTRPPTMFNTCSTAPSGSHPSAHWGISQTRSCSRIKLRARCSTSSRSSGTETGNKNVGHRPSAYTSGAGSGKVYTTASPGRGPPLGGSEGGAASTSDICLAALGPRR